MAAKYMAAAASYLHSLVWFPNMVFYQVCCFSFNMLIGVPLTYWCSNQRAAVISISSLILPTAEVPPKNLFARSILNLYAMSLINMIGLQNLPSFAHKIAVEQIALMLHHQSCL